ncbi:hypothetical protein D3C81_2304050 [compost metagenome]
MRGNGVEFVGRLAGTRRRQLDVQAARSATRDAEGGMGLAGQQDFFDLAHGDFLGVRFI